MIEFQHPLEHERALGTCQAQCITVERLRDVKLARQKRLLGQPRQAHQAHTPEGRPEHLERRQEMRPRSLYATLQMQAPALQRLPAGDQLLLHQDRWLGQET
ncbi:hypothetical protein D3C73_983730 [compost metagenome]